jgi:predicted nucleic acid-binding protein
LILVDSSVWVDWINRLDTPQTMALEREVIRDLVVVGDLVLCEVLMGVRDDAAARRVAAALGRFPTASLASPALAPEAAANYRRLRGLGITIRSTIDVLIAAWCMRNNAALLHRDRDFDVMAQHLGLRVVRA